MNWELIPPYPSLKKLVSMDYFIGTFTNTIDDNNRLSIPAKFRKVLSLLDEGSLIVSKGQANYLKLYPSRFWQEQIGEKVRKLPQMNAKADGMRRWVGENTTDAKLDKAGRVNIPADYYEHAGIVKGVRIVGSVDTIQLWDPEIYDKQHGAIDEEALAQAFDEYDI